MAYQAKKYQKFVATAATATLVAQAVAPLAFAATVSDFTDVAPQYQEAVSFLLEKGASNGKTETQFGVYDNITRQDAAVQLVKVLGLEVDTTITKTKFTDVPARTAPYVQALVDAGITSGKTETTFGANEEITRGQIAVWVAKGFGLEGSGEVAFTDVASQYKEAVSALVENKVTSGKTETQFGTNEKATRGQFAIFLYRAANVEVVEEGPEFTIISNDLEVDNIADIVMFNTLFEEIVVLPTGVNIEDVDFVSNNTAVIKDNDSNEEGTVASTQNGETIIYVDTITVVDNKGTDTEEDDETYVLTLDENFNVSVNIADNYDEFKIVANAQDTQNAVAEGGVAILGSDIVVEKEELVGSGYGKTGIAQTNLGVIDGNGKTLSVEGANNSTWDSAIYTKGGTIKNVTINSGFRGIFIDASKGDVVVDNVTIDGTTYAISSDNGGNNKLIVTNSTLNGWTSFAGTHSEVSFTNCNFGKSNGYAYLRPYSSTTLTDCEFSAEFKLDSRHATITLKNCKVGDTLVTTENVIELLGATAGNVTIEN